MSSRIQFQLARLRQLDRIVILLTPSNLNNIYQGSQTDLHSFAGRGGVDDKLTNRRQNARSVTPSDVHTSCELVQVLMTLQRAAQIITSTLDWMRSSIEFNRLCKGRRLVARSRN